MSNRSKIPSWIPLALAILITAASTTFALTTRAYAQAQERQLNKHDMILSELVIAMNNLQWEVRIIRELAEKACAEPNTSDR